MKKMDLSQLSSGKTLEWDLPERSWVKLHAISDKPFNVSIVDGDGVEHLVAHSNGNPITLSRSFAGSSKLTLNGGARITAQCQIAPEQAGEPAHDLPAFVPDLSNNPLKALRDRIRREMGVQREAFELLQDTDFPGYEIDDDEPDYFEEHFAKRPAPGDRVTKPAPEPTDEQNDSEGTPDADNA